MNLTVLGLGDQWEILSGHFDKISQQSHKCRPYHTS
jgi:hypothetical protein